MIDVINWTTPQAMARELVTRPHEISTVQTMVYNDFGVRLTCAELDQMRAESQPVGFHRTSKEWTIPIGHVPPINSLNCMESFSKALLARICAKHPRVIKAAEASGRLAVWA